MRNRTTLAITLIVALVATAALAGGCWRTSARTDLGLGASTETTSSAAATGTTSGSANPKAPTTVTPNGAEPGDDGGTSGGSGSSGSGASGGSGGSGASGSGGSSSGGSGSGKGSGGKTAPAATTSVRIKYWNDVTSGKAAAPRIVIGNAVFAPAGSAKPILGSLGPVTVEETTKLLVYPDGPNGKVFTVPILITAAMSPTTDLDAIHVSISNDTIRVLGNPVDNFEYTFKRFGE